MQKNIFAKIMDLNRYSASVIFTAALSSFALPAPDYPAGPGPLPEVRTGHPRIWFNSENIAVLRSRWNQGAFIELKNYVAGYLQSTTAYDKTVANALAYLATGDSMYARMALTTVNSIIDSNAYHFSSSGYFGANCDAVALVFDWCYPWLADSTKARLIAALVQRSAVEKTRLSSDWHESWGGAMEYMSTCLAICGEAGVDDSGLLADAQKWLHVWTGMSEEVCCDGGYRPYQYQAKFQILPAFLWTGATNEDYAAKARFNKNFSVWFAYRLLRDKYNLVPSEGDNQVRDEGYYYRNTVSPFALYLAAAHFDDPLAQWIGNSAVQHSGWHSGWNEPDWLSFIAYDSSIIAQSPRQLAMPLSRLFECSGMVCMRSGWNYQGDARNDIHAWFYCGHIVNHSSRSQQHLEIWRGDDELAIRGGNYMGQSAIYNKYWHESISRNTVLFPPKNSLNPDRDGGESSYYFHGGTGDTAYPNGRYDAELDKKYYPFTAQNDPYTSHYYRGEIIYYENDSFYTLTTGDASFAYAQMKYYYRDVAFVRPDLFIICDRFEAASDIDSVRWLLHTKSKPSVNAALSVVQGNAAAGILRAQTDSFTVERKYSRMDVSLVWPGNAVVKMIGGDGYESYADGENYHKDEYMQAYAAQYAKSYAAGQWRTEFVVAPSQAEGQIITAILVSSITQAPRRPSLQIQSLQNGKSMSIQHYDGEFNLFLPDVNSGNPRITVIKEPIGIKNIPPVRNVSVRSGAAVGVYSIAGKSIRKSSLPGAPGDSSPKMPDANMAALPCGIYIISAIDGSGRMHFSKMLIKRNAP